MALTGRVTSRFLPLMQASPQPAARTLLPIENLPVELKKMIIKDLPRKALWSCDLTPPFRGLAQELLFAQLKFNASNDLNGKGQTHPMTVVCFTFALLRHEKLRGFVQTLDLDFGCYCRDRHPLHSDWASSDTMVLARGAHKHVGQMWAPMPPDMQELHEMLWYWGRRRDHQWYRNMFMFILPLVPCLRELTVRTREWGTRNPHSGAVSALEFHEGMRDIVSRTATVLCRGIDQYPSPFKKLEKLSLRTWAKTAEWNSSAHCYANLLNIPTLQAIEVDDLLLWTQPDVGSTNAKAITVHAQSNTTGALFDTKDDVLNFLAQCQSLTSLTITPRTNLWVTDDEPALPVPPNLESFRLLRGLDPTIGTATDLSRLAKLATLEINWVRLCRAGYDFVQEQAYNRPLDLFTALPASLTTLHIINEGSADAWTTLNVTDMANLCYQLQLLRTMRDIDRDADSLTVIIDLFPKELRGFLSEADEAREHFLPLLEGAGNSKVAVEWRSEGSFWDYWYDATEPSVELKSWEPSSRKEVGMRGRDQLPHTWRAKYWIHK